MRRLFIPMVFGSVVLLCALLSLLSPGDLLKSQQTVTTENWIKQQEAEQELRQADADHAGNRMILYGLVTLAGGLIALWGGALAYNYHADHRRQRELLIPDDNGAYPLVDPRLIARELAQPLANVLLPQLTAALYASAGAATIERARRWPEAPHTFSPRYDLRGAAQQQTIEGSIAPAALEQRPQLPGIVDLDTMLQTWKPTLDSILLAVGPGGSPISVPAGKIWNLAIAGPTGEGKSNILRLILSQILALGGKAVLGDPKYCPLDPETGEDWRPIEARLFMKPAVAPTEIASLLDWSVEELERRLELRRKGQTWGGPLFLALDEMAAIVETVEDAPEKIGYIIRMGRAVGLLTIGSATDWLVKTVGGSSGAREQFRSAYYLGGDLRTGAALLDMSQKEIDDGALGGGLALLRSKATPRAELVRVPLASNQAIYRLLPGPNEADVLDLSSRLEQPAGSPLQANAYVAATASESRGALTPDEARAFSLFTGGADVAAIVKELYGVSSSQGRKYQDASASVQAMLRRALGGSV